MTCDSLRAMSNDFFREIDLNPTVNGSVYPVLSPSDPRAMFYFGFIANFQELDFNSSFPLLVSFSYPGLSLMPDLVMRTGQVKYEFHPRSNLLIWIDPSIGTPPIGNPAVIRVRAWS